MANNNDKYKNHSREELIDELETLKKKKYGLIWDKKNSQEMLDAFVNWENVPENFTPKQFPILKEVKNKEIETDKSKATNLLIEGDNYHSLAVLNFTHQNKIDVIYIDPPYNTGNKDFIYNDKFIDKEDPFRHSKWLSFMEKRLRLAHRLLKNTGVIFISIDDHEQAQLKLLCDEIFGEKNFIDSIIWDKKSSAKGVPPKNMMVNVHEYIIAYQKGDGFQFVGQERTEESGKFKNPDNDPRGPWRESNIKSTIKPMDQAFTIVDPNTGKEYTNTWAFSKKSLERMIKEERILWKDTLPKQKEFMQEMRNENMAIRSNWGVFDAQSTTVFLKELLPNTKFDNPKPISLMEYLVRVAIRKDATILDFFAGSGTTAHAVLKTNAEDGGSRKFILCTNNENKIATDVCYPRVEKVINGYKNSKGEKVAGLGGNLKYFKTDFVGSDSTDKNKRDLVNKSTEMICIKENIFDLVADGGLDYRIYQKGKKFLGVIFEIDAVADFKKEAEKHKGNFTVYCFSYTEATPEKEFKGLKNKYVLKPIPAVILRIYLEIFKK
jgi:adenine-specific DNA-methyltransferase